MISFWEWVERWRGIYQRDFYLFLDIDLRQVQVENLPRFTESELEHEQ